MCSELRAAEGFDEGSDVPGAPSQTPDWEVSGWLLSQNSAEECF